MHQIDISTLIKLWIAQGFVKLLDQNRCLEEVGNEYLMDLLWRSLFQEAEMDEFGNIIQTRKKLHHNQSQPQSLGHRGKEMFVSYLLYTMKLELIKYLYRNQLIHDKFSH
jgi:hypothetical protein